MGSLRNVVNRLRSQQGVTLIELMMALVILSIGLMAVSQLFPAGVRGQVRDRLFSSGNYYAQEKLEEVAGKNWSDPELSLGRHPVANFETLGLTNALFIGGAELDSNFKLAAANIPNIDVLPVQGINVYDILRRGKLVLSKAAVEALEERFK